MPRRLRTNGYWQRRSHAEEQRQLRACHQRDEETEFIHQAQRQRVLRATAEEDVSSRRRVQNAGTVVLTHNTGRNASTAEIDQHSCGPMNGCCQLCSGLFFLEERNTRGRYVHCCHDGKIIEEERNYPEEMRELITGRHPLSDEFFDRIRQYNSLLSFSSMGAQVEPPSGHGPYCLRIHGVIYHKTSHLYPQNTGGEKYAQLYILDAEQALRQRLRISASTPLNVNLLTLLDNTIRRVNPYAEAFKMMKEFEEETLRVHGAEAAANIKMYIKEDRVPAGAHRGRYNAPVENEVAAVFKSTDGVPPTNRDVVIHPKGGGLISINTLNPNLEPMTYPIFFPHGDAGFRTGQNYTELKFYCHRVSFRRDCFNPIMYGRKLFQQYLVDAYVKVEGNRLSYLRFHQKDLRVENYMGLADYVHRLAERTGARCGVPVILPSTFIGSPRNMHQNFQDAMAIVRDFGKPDLFLTFTCNPKWPEIQENLCPGQKAHDRPDIVARVFDLKKKALLDDIRKNHVLGVTIADIHVIEFQKRGLPHMHLLLILHANDKIRDSDTIDTLVCAELPDADVDPVLHETVRRTMIHGPCGVLNPNSPCMADGVCSKGYPKAFQEHTIDNFGGYPLYRRRDNGRHLLIREKIVDNRWVVPYNPFLSKKYNAHLNVEICSSVQSVKYIFKYVYKGHDAATIILEEAAEEVIVWDEIKNFLNARYVSAPEAAWRLFEKKMHEKSHVIIRLPVHLQNMQQVYFADREEEQALEAASRKLTMLTGWFDLNVRDHEARQFLYAEIPKHFVWKNNKWERRQRSFKSIVSRLYSVSPRDIERFHMRLLLCHVPGAKSFDELREFQNVQYATYKETCIARNLLESDDEWRKCLREARQFQMPSQLRQLFCFICVFCQPANPRELFEEFQLDLTEDFSRQYSEEESIHKCLLIMKEQLQVHNMSLQEFGLPQPPAFVREEIISNFIFTEDREEGQRMKAILNPEQLKVFEAVLKAVNNPDERAVKAFCLNAFAGSGKSFLFNAIIRTVRGMGHTVVPTAWTGIAATILHGGRTVHSTFKLPVPLTDSSCCRITPISEQGAYLRNAKLIVWDECTMTPRRALEAVDECLKDLTGCETPFGGKVILLGGDWRQILPVSVHANRVSTIESCLKNSFLWKHFHQLSLRLNMRTDERDAFFSKWLLKLGDGTLRSESDIPEQLIEVPQECVVSSSPIDEVFGNEGLQNLKERAILCPTNEDSLRINEKVLHKLPGEAKTFYSADSFECEEEEVQQTYQMDFINSLTPSGMPPHALNLKEGAIVMLLRNLNSSAGLCNGTRLIVKRASTFVIHAEVVTGHMEGSHVFIPRITMCPSDTNLPFQLRRRQFPLRLAFSMTINKAQGQTLKTVGIHLDRPVFSHGMLYVAFSRATTMRNLHVWVKNGAKQGKILASSNKIFTPNVVYREIFNE